MNSMNRTLLMPVAGLLGVAYLASTTFILVHATGHVLLNLLLVQYAFLLPAILCFFAAKRIPGTPASPGTKFPRAVSYLLYVFLAASFALALLHRDKGIQWGDEVAYRFQSSVLLEGRLAADAPPQITPDVGTYLRLFHFNHFLIFRNKWTGQYYPGWPAFLALGTLIHQGWVLNPLLGLCILWVTYRIASFVFDERIGELALVLMVASPFFLLNSVGFMAHPLCGVLLAAATLFLFRGLESGRVRHFLVMLLLVAFALLVRPFTAFCVGAMLGVTALWSVRHQRGQFLRLIVLGGVVGTSAAGVFLAYNHALTGSYLRSPYALEENRDYPGEIRIKTSRITRNLERGTRWAFQTTDLYAAPFVFLLAAYALATETQRRRGAWILGAVFGALMIGCVVGPGISSSLVGQRYWYECFFVVAILGARGWSLLRTRWSLDGTRVAAVAIVAVLIFHYSVAINTVRNQVTPSIRLGDAIAGLKLTDTVVFLKGDFAPDYNLNAADWRHAPVFYMVDPGASQRPVVAEGLKRSHWVVVTYDAATQSAHVESQP